MRPVHAVHLAWGWQFGANKGNGGGGYIRARPRLLPTRVVLPCQSLQGRLRFNMANKRPGSSAPPTMKKPRRRAGLKAATPQRSHAPIARDRLGLALR